ncbi:hypothetical protein Nepgr_032611 [Nepenthes gracilis]|uniref:Uncharacterized protein n=1 Tax=Nepenthes gracilis TaxID=150966 RepID=A0AAD3TIY8_NEPGR|nr:hypothetical protein Nepgr_032611 [Nepenthes gracilis]
MADSLPAMACPPVEPPYSTWDLSPTLLSSSHPLAAQQTSIFLPTLALAPSPALDLTSLPHPSSPVTLPSPLYPCPESSLVNTFTFPPLSGNKGLALPSVLVASCPSDGVSPHLGTDVAVGASSDASSPTDLAANLVDTKLIPKPWSSWADNVQGKVAPEAPLPEKIKLKSCTDPSTDLDSYIEVGVDYQCKPVRCSDCQKFGHSRCQPKMMYKATGRLLAKPLSICSCTPQKPKFPQIHVKDNTTAISTSNSFDILLDEDGSSNLVKPSDIPQSMGNPTSLDTQINSIENPSHRVVMDGLVSPDTINTYIDPVPPESSVTNMSNEEILSNKNSFANLPLQLSQAEFDIHVAVSCDLDEVSTCSKAGI